MQPLRRTVERFLKKLKIELPHDLAILSLGIYLEKTNTVTQKETRTPMFTAALLTVTETWKQPKCSSTDEWIKKVWCPRKPDLKETRAPQCSSWHFTIARTWKQPRCPSDEWIRKLWYIYTIEYHSAIKKNSFESVLMRWMKLEPIIQ